MAEANFFFGGVDVDVDRFGRELDEEEEGGVAPASDEGVIDFVNGVVDNGGGGGAVVDENELIGAVFAAGLRESGEAGEGDVVVCELNGAELVEEGGLVEGADAVGEGAGGVELVEGAVVGGEADADGGVGEGVDEDALTNVAELGLFGAEKFTASGDVIKEVFDVDLGADGAAGFFAGEHFSAFDLDAGSFELVGGAGGEGEAGDGGDGGEGFSAKAEGGDAFDVGFVLNFTGGVAFEAEQCLVAGHAVSVVEDGDGAGAAAFDVDFEAGAAGIDGVFEAFFDDGGGAFDDFAGGNLVDYLIIQKAYGRKVVHSRTLKIGFAFGKRRSSGSLFWGWGLLRKGMVMRGWLAIAVCWVGVVSASTPISFDADVRPILSDRCYFCHGPDATDIQGDLQLHTFEHATSDRDGFGPAIVPGKPEESLMWKRISSKKARYVMPPSSSHIPLDESELAVIKQWIEEGAAYEGLWSLEPLPERVP